MASGIRGFDAYTRVGILQSLLQITEFVVRRGSNGKAHHIFGVFREGLRKMINGTLPILFLKALSAEFFGLDDETRRTNERSKRNKTKNERNLV
jgi:hypothetical protein